MTETPQILTDIVNRTDSVLILFFVLAIVALIGVILPLYRLRTKHRAEVMAHEKEMERERADREAGRVREIITVVSTNTEAMHQLNAVIGVLAAASDTAHQRMQDSISEMAFCLKSRPCVRER